MRAIKVKHHHGREGKPDEGKGKLKDEGFGGDRTRNPPKLMGRLREVKCKQCVEKEMVCYSQEVGKACISCAQLKLKCEDL